MADVEQLFSAYVAEHKAGGEADPVGYLQRLDGADRAELATLIDAYLVRSPGREWDAEAFEGSPEQELATGMERSLVGSSGTWPMLLPLLRERARIRRADLVERLAGALGVGGQKEQVAAYYHQMEQGRLDSEGVSTRVLEVLGSIVGSSAQALREAGEAAGSPPESPPGAVFARTAMPDAQYAPPPAPPEEKAGVTNPESVSHLEADEEHDQVTRLFTGGD